MPSLLQMSRMICARTSEQVKVDGLTAADAVAANSQTDAPCEHVNIHRVDLDRTGLDIHNRLGLRHER